MSEWKFGDTFPSIEVDTEYWKTLTPKEKGQYLLRLAFQEKDLGSRIGMLNYIATNVSKVGRAFVKNKEFGAYLDIVENATNLISVSAAVGNIFKAKQKHRNTKNNEIAKLMGFANGDFIDETAIDITHAMADAFLDMSEYHKNKYSIKIDVTQNSDQKDSGQSDAESMFKKITMAGTIDGDIKWGIIIKTSNGLDEDADTTSSTTCKLYYPISGMKIHASELEDKFQQIMYELYVEKVDTSRNYIMIRGTKLEICERVEITEEITNINMPRITHAMRKVLEEESRRGAVFVGEPGVGKTIAVHKLVNNFRDTLVFWVSVDCINSVHGIRTVFKLFKMFKNSIIVFDDLDAAPFTSKDEVTNEFLNHLDGKNNKDLTGYYIATVNDPSKLHMTLINRPERFDDVFHVKNPQTHDEVSAIILNKCRERGYYHADDDTRWDGGSGEIKFAFDDVDYLNISQRILDASFTHVQIAGLVSDCHTYTEDNNITISLLEDAVKSRLESISTANLVSKKGRLHEDRENVSDEAYASYSKPKR